jgi:polar amino acid transport system ATP-binding protein
VLLAYTYGQGFAAVTLAVFLFVWALVAEVLRVIRELAEGGMTMLIATHEMGFARDIADRVCFLDAGVILEQGTPAEIFGAPREPRTQQFLQRIVEAGRL